MDQVNPILPEKWLLQALQDNLSADSYASVLAAYAVVKRRYGVTQRLRTCEAELSRYERGLAQSTSDYWRRSYTRKIATRQAAIERYQKELDSSAE